VKRSVGSGGRRSGASRALRTIAPPPAQPLPLPRAAGPLTAVTVAEPYALMGTASGELFLLDLFAGGAIRAVAAPPPALLRGGARAAVVAAALSADGTQGLVAWSGCTAVGGGGAGGCIARLAIREGGGEAASGEPGGRGGGAVPPPPSCAAPMTLAMDIGVLAIVVDFDDSLGLGPAQGGADGGGGGGAPPPRRAAWLSPRGHDLQPLAFPSGPFDDAASPLGTLGASACLLPRDLLWEGEAARAALGAPPSGARPGGWDVAAAVAARGELAATLASGALLHLGSVDVEGRVSLVEGEAPELDGGRLPIGLPLRLRGAAPARCRCGAGGSRPPLAQYLAPSFYLATASSHLAHVGIIEVQRRDRRGAPPREGAAARGGAGGRGSGARRARQAVPPLALFCLPQAPLAVRGAASAIHGGAHANGNGGAAPPEPEPPPLAPWERRAEVRARLLPLPRLSAECAERSPILHIATEPPAARRAPRFALARANGSIVIGAFDSRAPPPHAAVLGAARREG
jgi:hypothetical protein